MKKSVKVFLIFLITCIIFLVAGGIMVISGGIKSSKEIYDLLDIQYIGELYDFNDSKTVNSDDISVIEICNSECNILVNSTTDSKITANLYGKYIDSNEPTLKILTENNKVKISADTSISSVLTTVINAKVGIYNDLTLEVLIPDNYKGDIIFDDAAGDIECSLEDFELNEIKFKNTAGYVDVITSDRYYTKLEIEDTAGDFDVKGSFKSVEISDTAGDINVTVTSIFDSINISDTLGEICVNVPADTKGKINVKDCMGGFITDFDSKSDEPFNYQGSMNGGGNSSFTASDSLGVIRLEKISD